jgi:hypothetical protein
MSAPERPEWKRLAARVDETLHYAWDPIGVRDFPEARDEYDNSMSPVMGLLKRGASVEDLAEFLGQVARDGMGLSDAPRRAKRDSSTAELLVRWREHHGADRT